MGVFKEVFHETHDLNTAPELRGRGEKIAPLTEVMQLIWQKERFRSLAISLAPDAVEATLHDLRKQLAAAETDRDREQALVLIALKGKNGLALLESFDSRGETFSIRAFHWIARERCQAAIR